MNNEPTSMEEEFGPLDQQEDTSKYGYMCRTDWNWELGEARGGTEVYASVEDCKRSRKCVENCGIVKVKIDLVEVVEPGRGFSSAEEG
jgi:hypothetical protein